MRLTLGTDSVLARTRVHQSGSLTIPSREGDLTYFGQPPGHDVNADTWTATTGDLGVFASVSWTKGAWTLVPGLRADAFPVDGDRLVPPVGSTPRIGYSQLAWALDPRLSLAWGPLPDFIVRGAAGLYHQPVDPEDLSAIFGSPTLGPSRALHGAVALWKKLSETSSVELTGFYRRLDELTVRSPQPTPPLGEALSSDGRGRVVGASAELRRSLSSGTQGWLTYTLARSSRATSDGRLRLFDFDQTHVLTGVAAHQRGPWSFGARIRYATGMPRTPVVGAFFDAREGISQPFFGAPNSRRLPAFFQCDARIDRQVVAGSVTLIVYVDLQNVLARRNPEEVVYSQDLKTSGYLTGAPLLVLVGLRLES
jgi:hypothetical protein